LRWNRTYGGTNFDQLYGIVELSAGGFALTGNTMSFGAGSSDGWLVRVDSNGNLLWNTTYGGIKSDKLYDIVGLSDGGFALVGYTESFGVDDSDGWLVRVDSSGGLLWNVTYGGMKIDKLKSIVGLSDGGFALYWNTGTYGAGRDDGWLVRVDSNGNLLWNTTYGGRSYDVLFGVVGLSDGGFALAGYSCSYGVGDPDGWLVRVDAGGNLLWNKTYGGTSMAFFMMLLKLLTADTY
jgi:hypothetical protein